MKNLDYGDVFYKSVIFSWSALMKYAIGPSTEVIGRENVPKKAILVPNHISFGDSPAVVYGIQEPVYFLIHDRFKKHIGSDLLRYTHNLILDNGNISNREVLRWAKERLEFGNYVGIFPEGKMHTDDEEVAAGRLNDFQRGVKVMSQYTKTPCVPVAISGTNEWWPRGKSLPKIQIFPPYRTKVRVQFGEPIPYNDNALLDKCKKRIEEMLKP